MADKGTPKKGTKTKLDLASVAGLVVALAISAANRIDDPPAIGRNLRIGDPDEIEQVFFGDGSFRIARLGSRILSGE